MPTVQDNLQFWSAYDWKLEGNEWTVGYGGTESGWQWCVLPRIRRFVPCEHILEIAPGHGVWTSYLRQLCTRMTLVDLTPRCIEFCRQKFGERGMSYIVNDGFHLTGVADSSIDLVFSWHSLVHAEHAVMRSYVHEMRRVLRPGGFGIIHHTNFAALAAASPEREVVKNIHWRGEDMSAEKFRRDCAEFGLRCVYQELVPWGGDELVDCFSLVQRPRRPSELTRPPIVEANPFFWHQIRTSQRIDARYRETPVEMG
jgi:SAM-dependent methyltransferase